MPSAPRRLSAEQALAQPNSSQSESAFCVGAPHEHMQLRSPLLCPCSRCTQGFKPRRSLEVMMFTSEEPTRFKLSCIGSRAMAGALSTDVLDAKLDENGTNFRDVRQMLLAHCRQLLGWVWLDWG